MTFIELVLGCGCLSLLVFSVILVGGVRMSSVGKGEHTGYITAVEQEGYIYKNYRVYVKTDLSSSQEDIYCVNRNRKDLADKLKEVAITKQRVTVEYSGVWGIGWGLCYDYEIANLKETK